RIQIVSTMVGDRNRRHTAIDGTLRVIDPGYAFDHERSVPILSQPGEVVPGRRRCLHPFTVRTEKGGGLLIGRRDVRRRQVGEVTRTRVRSKPAWSSEYLRRKAYGDLGIDLLWNERTSPVSAVRK